MRCCDLAFELIGHSLLLGQYPEKAVETGFAMFGAVLLKVFQNWGVTVLKALFTKNSSQSKNY
jgi:hypothetical protein